MNAPKRLAIKLFIDNPVTPSQIVPIFQRWIQRNRVEGLLVDVADYQHVHNGPGIILIGYEGDYAYDLSEGRIGIQYTLKQTRDFSLAEALAISIRRVLQAATQLVQEKSLSNLQIITDELQITFRDRLNFPNNTDTREALIPDVQALITDMYSTDVKISAIEGDSREALSLLVSSPSAVALSDLLGSVAVR